eukprot:GHVL01000529.1.p1 GENE.GHVL01000529.1~~GHVL01000529.1.p1  ORF type:complete len:802 (+),score=174.07 GHVL01000529.1:17-2422(+)
MFFYLICFFFIFFFYSRADGCSISDCDKTEEQANERFENIKKNEKNENLKEIDIGCCEICVKEGNETYIFCEILIMLRSHKYCKEYDKSCLECINFLTFLIKKNKNINKYEKENILHFVAEKQEECRENVPFLRREAVTDSGASFVQTGSVLVLSEPEDLCAERYYRCGIYVSGGRHVYPDNVDPLRHGCTAAFVTSQITSLKNSLNIKPPLEIDDYKKLREKVKNLKDDFDEEELYIYEWEQPCMSCLYQCGILYIKKYKKIDYFDELYSCLPNEPGQFFKNQSAPYNIRFCNNVIKKKISFLNCMCDGDFVTADKSEISYTDKDFFQKFSKHNSNLCRALCLMRGCIEGHSRVQKCHPHALSCLEPLPMLSNKIIEDNDEPAEKVDTDGLGFDAYLVNDRLLDEVKRRRIFSESNEFFNDENESTNGQLTQRAVELNLERLETETDMGPMAFDDLEILHRLIHGFSTTNLTQTKMEDWEEKHFNERQRVVNVIMECDWFSRDPACAGSDADFFRRGQLLDMAIQARSIEITEWWMAKLLKEELQDIALQTSQEALTKNFIEEIRKDPFYKHLYNKELRQYFQIPFYLSRKFEEIWWYTHEAPKEALFLNIEKKYYLGFFNWDVMSSKINENIFFTKKNEKIEVDPKLKCLQLAETMWMFQEKIKTCWMFACSAEVFRCHKLSILPISFYRDSIENSSLEIWNACLNAVKYCAAGLKHFAKYRQIIEEIDLNFLLFKTPTNREESIVAFTELIIGGVTNDRFGGWIGDWSKQTVEKTEQTVEKTEQTVKKRKQTKKKRGA